MFKGITLQDFNQYFKNENVCRQYLFNLKWKSGFVCRRCGHDKYSKGRTKFHARCCKCKFDESITSHSIFHRIQFSLKKAFAMAFQISVFKKGISSLELAKVFGVNQKTAWTFKRKVQEAMAKGFPSDDDKRFQISLKNLDSIILKGRPENSGGLQRFHILIRQHHGKNTFTSVRAADQNLGVEMIRPNLYFGHYVDEGKDINMWNFKSWLTGTHHHCSEKYLHGYFSEFFFRYDRRRSQNTILHELLSLMIGCQPYNSRAKGGSNG